MLQVYSLVLKFKLEAGGECPGWGFSNMHELCTIPNLTATVKEPGTATPARQLLNLRWLRCVRAGLPRVLRSH